MSAVSQYRAVMDRFTAFISSPQLERETNGSISGHHASLISVRESLDAQSVTYAEQFASLTRAMQCLEIFLKSGPRLVNWDYVRGELDGLIMSDSSVFLIADVLEVRASGPFIDPTNPEKREYNDLATLRLTCKVLNAISRVSGNMTREKLDALVAASIAETNQFYAEMPEESLANLQDPVVQDISERVDAVGTYCSSHYSNFRHASLGASSNNWHIYPEITTTKVIEGLLQADSNRLLGRITDRQYPTLGADPIKTFGMVYERCFARPFNLFEIDPQGVPKIYSFRRADAFGRKLDELSPPQRHIEISLLKDSTFSLSQ